jgi:3-isopropylmalate/(R)-2-methylmalate dehydratase large subunit
MAPRTLLQKIWDDHQILEEDGQSLLMVGCHLGHDGSYYGFSVLDERGLKLRRPDQFFATPDHGVPTSSRSLDDVTDPAQRRGVETLERNHARHGFTHFGLGDVRQGIVHVVGPEQGITQPGMLLVCGDSHTSTHGALGALAFGIGASDVAHVLATQTVWRKRPKALRITVEGQRPRGVTAKDVVLAIIARIGANGAAQHVIEYAGPAIRAMSIEERLTVCNMSIEAGGRAGMVAPDDTTIDYLKGRPFAPQGADWNAAVAYWRSLPSDPGAVFDTEVTLDAGAMEPMITWGNSPENAIAVSARIPSPEDADSAVQRDTMREALDYMGLYAGQAVRDIAIDQVFIGSCTNARLSDLREAAAIARQGRAKVPAMVSPGSSLVKQQAEAEGLDRIFREAGFEWRESGCSMCVGMNGDLVAAGKRCASTSNRNFRGRQGKDSRTHLMSPAMAAAAALHGRITDVRELAQGAA